MILSRNYAYARRMVQKRKQINVRVDDELAAALGEQRRLEPGDQPPSLSEAIRIAVVARLNQLRKAAERRK